MSKLLTKAQKDIVRPEWDKMQEFLNPKKKSVAKKMKRGNYSIFKIEGDKHTRLKHNLSHAEMSEQLKNNPAYRGGEGFGFGGRRTYPKK